VTEPELIDTLLSIASELDSDVADAAELSGI